MPYFLIVGNSDIFINDNLPEFNVSLGYPLRRSPLYALLNLLAKTQGSRRKKNYYTKDYLNLLRHPLIKNLNFVKDSSLTRVIVHKIEEILMGLEESLIGGSLFLSLSQIEAEDAIFLTSLQTLQSMGMDVEIEDCRQIVKRLHFLLFESWEQVSTTVEFAERLKTLLNNICDKSNLGHFAFNLKVIDRLYNIADEFQHFSFSKKEFAASEIWDIFQNILDSEVVSFVGSPLKGTQILGLFETRSLSFENVIVMDMNESILPKLKIYEPLIPREVMLNLGLNRLEKEEEIQRYHFLRLLSSAKNTYLVYEENQEKEKSRFIEDLLWIRQRTSKKLEVTSIPKASFSLRVKPSFKLRIQKNSQVVEFLKEATYSASRINTYINCPLQFYYQYVLGLAEREDLLEDPQSSCIGIFMHKLLEETFSKFKGKKPVIDADFKKYFFRTFEDNFDKEIARRMRSDSYLLREIIINRLKKFLDNEIERNVAKIICLEEQRYGRILLRKREVEFVYTVDRIDQFEDSNIVIIDYKTGSYNYSPKKLKILQSIQMSRESIRENIKSFQLPLYYYFVSKEFPSVPMNAETYSLRTLETQRFISPQDYPQKELVIQICLKALEYILDEIFDPGVGFEPDKEERKCQYCPFINLCR